MICQCDVCLEYVTKLTLTGDSVYTCLKCRQGIDQYKRLIKYPKDKLLLAPLDWSEGFEYGNE